MLRLSLTLACAASALALAALTGTWSAPAAEAAAQKIGVVKTGNRTKVSGGTRSIDQIVVHVTEGSFWGSIRWLRNPHAGGSSHFVVSREGEVVQMVSTSDIAWHAGNRWTNRRSIGIEHEGYSGRGGFTEAQYEASARLVAYLSKRFGIPLDRRHVIGHHEVPHPTVPGRKGGAHAHWDPGPHWRWGHYLELSRRFVEDVEAPTFARVAIPEPKPAVTERRYPCYRRSVHSTTIYRGQTLAGIAPWRAQACGRLLHRVDFLVDGELLWSDRVRPFAFARDRGLNTTTLANGWHTLTVRAHGPRGYRVRKNLRVKIDNPPFAVEPEGLDAGQAVTGLVGLTAVASAPAKRVALVVDGEVVASSAGEPHRLEWDSTALANGRHELELRALAVDGRSASTKLPLLVANEEDVAAPTPRVVWQSLHDWQSVSGPVGWQVLAEGAVEQVEFWIDGRLRWTAGEPPYLFGGEAGVWDASGEAPGLRELLVRVVGPGGQIAESHASVFVSP